MSGTFVLLRTGKAEFLYAGSKGDLKTAFLFSKFTKNIYAFL